VLDNSELPSDCTRLTYDPDFSREGGPSCDEVNYLAYEDTVWAASERLEHHSSTVPWLAGQMPEQQPPILSTAMP
jgi:hypothetical protein